MPDTKINVIKPKSGLSLPEIKMSPKLLMVLTVILATVAVITATLLYNRRNEPVTPNAPIPAPAATLDPTPTPAATPITCVISFTIGATPTPSGSPTPTPSTTPTPTPSSSPTPTPSTTPTPTPGPSATPNSCNGTCGSNANCSSNLICDVASGRCRQPACLTETDCGCDVVSTPTPTPGGTPNATPPTLTEAGSTLGTWTLSIAGAVLVTLGAIAIFAF